MFTSHFLVIAFLTFFIHCIDTMAYALRIAGVRSGKIATSAALFNFIFLFSRSATAIQIPILAKWVETEILSGASIDITSELHILIALSTVGTFVGATLIPKTHRILKVVVERVAETRSVFRSMIFFFTSAGRKTLANSKSAESNFNITSFTIPEHGSIKTIVANTFAIAFFTISGFSAIIAATLSPELRGTAVSLFSALNGFSSVISIAFVIPTIAIFVDETKDNVIADHNFYNFIAWLVVSRLIGTLLAHIFLSPTAILANWISHII